ncbi:hypothetical protein NYE33_20375 [Paenibacillus sp. FSL R10-2199]|uniref:hypothetical protein n=1 Tax=Paenibacillus sp. FSL R10-2199 TaxID=2975348 RepID=UPI0030F9FE6C
MKDGIWIVYDSEDGLVCSGNYDECLIEYVLYVEAQKDYVQNEGEFSIDLSERVILARVERTVYPVPVDEDDGGYEWEEEIFEFTAEGHRDATE